MNVRSKLPWTSLAIISVLTIVLFHNCSHAPIDHQNFPPIGKKVVLAPIQPNTQVKAYKDYKHVLTYFSVGDSALSYGDKVMVQFLDKNDGSVLAEYSTTELKDMHKITGCPEEVSAFLKNTYMGNSLFCNNSIDLSRVREIQIIQEGQPPKLATSYIMKYSRDELDMIALTVNAN